MSEQPDNQTPQPIQPVQPVQPIQAVQPAQAPQPTQPVQPVQPAQAVQPPQPVQPLQPEQTPSQPQPPAAPAFQAQPVAQTAPAAAQEQPISRPGPVIAQQFQDPTSGTPGTASGVPTDWPGAFGIYKYSKTAIRLVLVTVLLFGALSFVSSGILGLLFQDDLTFIGDIISFIISALVGVAVALASLSGIRGQKAGFSDMLSKSFPLLLKMMGLSILTGLILIASIILLIVPFFFVFPRLLLAPYYLVDQKLGIIDSLKASWAKSSGNVGKVYGIFGASFAMGLLALTIIGIPFAIYFLIMYSASTAVLYEYIRTRQAQAPVLS